jgi:hypothetical protein
MSLDDYIDLDEPHAHWRKCGIGEIPDDALVPYGLTPQERDEAAMDAAKVATVASHCRFVCGFER